MHQLRGEQEATAGGGEGGGRNAGGKYISLVFAILKFRSIHFLSSPRLRELLALWDFARRRILSDRHFGEWQKRGKAGNVENWQIGGRNAREQERKEGERRQKNEKRRKRQEKVGGRRRADGEVRNVTRNVRQSESSSDSAVPELSPPCSLRCTRSARAVPASAISLTGYDAVRRSSRRAKSRLLLGGGDQSESRVAPFLPRCNEQTELFGDAKP